MVQTSAIDAEVTHSQREEIQHILKGPVEGHGKGGDVCLAQAD